MYGKLLHQSVDTDKLDIRILYERVIAVKQNLDSHENGNMLLQLLIFFYIKRHLFDRFGGFQITFN